MKTNFFTALVASSLFVLTAAAPASAVDSMKDWEKILHSKISSFNLYPKNALNEGIEGTVKVRLTFSNDGAVEGVELVDPSGNRLLDRSAMRIALRLRELPALPEGRQSLSIVVPVTFQLEKDA